MELSTEQSNTTTLSSTQLRKSYLYFKLNEIRTAKKTRSHISKLQQVIISK